MECFNCSTIKWPRRSAQIIHLATWNNANFSVSNGTALTWTLLLPVWKEFTSTRNQMHLSDISRNPLQSCLVFHSILDLLQKTSFWTNFNSSYDIILSCLVKNSIQRNMNRGGGKRVGAGWKKSHPFTKITTEMNQIIIIYIWKIDGKGYMCSENQAFSTLNLRQRFMQTQFLPLLMIEFRRIRPCLAFPGQKNECSDMA